MKPPFYKIAEKIITAGLVPLRDDIEPDAAPPAEAALNIPYPRALVIMVELWGRGARFIYELKRAGFTVGVIAPPQHLVQRANVADARYLYSASAPLVSIRRAIRHWQPAYLFCLDDIGVSRLHQLFTRQPAPGLAHKGVQGLIERSLGDPGSYRIVASKMETLTLAESMGLRCPRTIAVSEEDALEKEISNRAYPVVVKVDGYSAGLGVRVARNAEEVRAAFHDFHVPLRWRPKIRRTLRKLPAAMLRTLIPQPRVIALQDYVEGRNANCSLACWQGEVLAGLSVECIGTANETGPSTVVRVINNTEMLETAKLLVHKLGISGFCGIDFIIDCLNRAWFLEINPRITPISHLVCGADLIGAIRSRITACPQQLRPHIREKTIAFFPEEWRRDPKSEYIHSAYHDVPWDHPSLMRALLDM